MTLPISDEDLEEAVRRAERLLNGAEQLMVEGLEISSDKYCLNIWHQQRCALSYHKKRSPDESPFASLRSKCTWSPSAFDGALAIMRENMVLEDLADL